MSLPYDFTLPSTAGEFTLSAQHGKNLVLYFYPKDDTPGCTTEGQEFRDLYPEFLALDTLIYGISRDSLGSHAKFCEKYSFPFPLLSDENEAVCTLFGVLKMKNLYGKQVMGVERSTFVFDKTGQLVKEWRGLKAPGHAAEVLAFVKSTLS
jgi:peroxiredoxin Q/BCP